MYSVIVLLRGYVYMYDNNNTKDYKYDTIHRCMDVCSIRTVSVVLYYLI